MSYVFLAPFFFAAAYFHLSGLKHFLFSHRHYKIFMLFFQQSLSPLFLSLVLALCRSFSRWASLACSLLSHFLCLLLSLYSKFVDMTINLSLTLKTTRIQKQFPVIRFRIYWLFNCLSFTRRGWLWDFPPKKLELQLGCHTFWLSYLTLVCLWCGWTGGFVHGRETSHYQNEPFPSSHGPLYQNEVKCSAFAMEMIFHSHANETHFHKKGCALVLILKERVFGTRKWSISRMHR